MANHLVQARISDELKLKADIIFTSMGMTTSEAIRIFLQQSVNVGGLPFQPVAKLPNSETISAMNETKGRLGRKFHDAKELFKDLDI